MATVYAKVNGKQRSATETLEISHTPGAAIDQVIAEYEASALATAQTIDLCTIPPFSAYRLVEFNHDALGANTSIKVGIAGALEEQLVDTSTVAAASLKPAAGGWKQTDVALNLVATNTGTITGSLQAVVQIQKRQAAIAL